jgi:Domain of unknown function (DUF4349)
MRFSWLKAAILAALVFVVLFVIRFMTVGPNGPTGPWEVPIQAAADAFEIGRKNYASSKKLEGLAAGQAASVAFDAAAAGAQKYEKVGSLTQVSTEFEADRSKIDDLIKGSAGVVQLERATGLKGGRSLQLGIGVPPDKFDAFIESVRVVGKSVAIEVVKNDKTNDYLQLRAKRATLDKARTALEDLRAGGGSTEERVNVQNRLTEIEQQIQDLGVSLGEFDTQNELCTVKLTLQERYKPVPWSVKHRAFEALLLAFGDYAMLGMGLFGLMAAMWIGVMVLREVRKIIVKSAAA